MFVSTGEVSLAAKLAEDGHGSRVKAGQEVRLLDIEADAGKGLGAFDSFGSYENAASLAEAIRDAASKAYGTAGPAFVKKLIDNGIERTASTVAELVETFCKNTEHLGSEGQIRRAAQRLGLMAAAGELAIEFGIVPWEKGAATAAAEFALEQWISSRGGSEAAEAIAAVSTVRLFIERYGDSRFEEVIVDSHGGEFADALRVIPNRAGWRKGRGENQFWMVAPEVWTNEVCAGLDPKMVAKVLAARGMLERAPDGLQKPQWINGRTTRTYTVTANLFSPLTTEKDVRGVSGVITGISEGAHAGENTNNTKDLTPLTPQKHTEGEKRDEYEERAAILEYDAGLSRDEAEDLAELDIPPFLERRPK
jgi:uncharacterized protein (DUF927 family)